MAPKRRSSRIAKAKLQPTSIIDLSDEIEDDQYVVETILGKRIIDGKTEYLIKYKGYSQSANLWQSIESLNCGQMIRKYERENRNGRTRRTRSRRNDISEFFEYEDIIGKRFLDGKVEYLVRWKGYTDEYNSWVGKDQLVHTESIEEYELKLIKKEEKFEDSEDPDHVEPLFIISDDDGDSVELMDCKSNTHIIDDESTDPMELQAADKANDEPKSEVNDQPKVQISENIVIKQAQLKTEAVIGQTSSIKEVLDIIRTGGEGRGVICRVKFQCIDMDSWVPYEQLKKDNPQKLIKYFETRIDWPHGHQ